MPNMSYCRMQNTEGDLRDCFENWEEVESEDEIQARARILKLAEKIVAEYGKQDED